MASFHGLRKAADGPQALGVCLEMVDQDELRWLLEQHDGCALENDELRRENERLLKALSPTAAPPAASEPEMCCGGMCVRAVCFIHGVGNG